MAYGEWKEELVLQAEFLMQEDVLNQSVRFFSGEFLLSSCWSRFKMPIYWVHNVELLG